MIGTLAAGAIPNLTNSGPIAAPAGPAVSGATGGTVGPVTVNTGGGAGKAPGWVWPVAGAIVAVGALLYIASRK